MRTLGMFQISMLTAMRCGAGASLAEIGTMLAIGERAEVESSAKRLLRMRAH